MICASEMGDKPQHASLCCYCKHTLYPTVLFSSTIVLFNMGLRVDIFSTSANNSLLSLPFFMKYLHEWTTLVSEV
jgi:hypothetical protein